ncbi:hypothetical protein TSUD_319750 [Trifolium subterraneum]|uniref:Reverse transcriptase zinc-binding domain-containing protein n=1 Tax=Trifolium subterraneum TaxID=3900 RepID=A0A2Z6NEE4_TRISU|nr:hypothetical protein TSUD_319750 [Trifolium subterraneum]
METAVARNLFTGYTFGERNPVSVSHLQFADDTLLLGAKSWANIRALRVVLVLFETMSGLKVNFHKNMLVGVNIPDSWLGEAASALCCKVGKIPFVYLSLPIGGDPRRLGFWEPVLTRLQNRLSGWKSRFLSFGGRLVLLKSVLTSLLVYALSFFKAPSGKWCWRMLVVREGLWFRVLAARYGVERGRLREGGRRGSVWWREIERIREGGELGGSWFGEIVSIKAQSLDRWQPDPDAGFTVRGAYQLLTSHASVSMDAADKLIWHPHVPLRVSFFAWRLLRDIHMFSGWIPGVALLFAAYLACMRVGYVDGKKSQIISRLYKQFPSDVRQDQASLLQMVEDDKCYFSFKLS